MKYDYLIVGAGITAATCAATLSPRGKRILVVDTRPHIGGNCYDYKAAGSFVHQYGPHIFHTPNPSVSMFLSKFTEWTNYSHSVCAEIVVGGTPRLVPFPYSSETEAALGASLDDQQIIDYFFRGYSKKMWGREWEDMPASIRNRVPKRQERSNYFPNEFVGMPKDGFTSMMERMFEKVDVLLGVSQGAWQVLAKQAKEIIYTGRVDLLPGVAEHEAHFLKHRTLDIGMSTDAKWIVDQPVLNLCHLGRKETRMTNIAKLTGGYSKVVLVETPREAEMLETAPFYPMTWKEEQAKHRTLLERAKRIYPNMHFLGRLATYRYLDMHQAVGAALAYCRKLTD